MSTYQFLNQESGPRVIDEALKLLGTREIAGPRHEKAILGWAKELGIENYNQDEIPWCGLFVAVVVERAGFESVKEPLWALNWSKFGTKQTVAMKGDILVFSRKGGNHVGFYVGEDKDCYHVLGGNQSNMVNIMRIQKTRLRHIRRCPWRQAQPATVRVINLEASGEVSQNEA